MNLKRLLNYACLSGALALLITACQEDRDENVASAVSVAEQPDIAVENGMLHFKDQSVWAATIQKMKETEDYNAHLASLGFENSLLNKYDAIKESDEVLDDYFATGKLPEIMDDLFASLLNEHAMVKIGETLYKVTDKYTFSAVDEKGSMRQKFQESLSLDKLPNVATFENIDHLAGKTMVIKSSGGEKKVNARFQGDEWYIEQYYPYRIKVGAWSRTYGLYTSIGVKINSEKDKKGGIFGGKKWRNDDANYLYCGGYARTQVCEATVPCSPVFDTPNSWNTRRNKHRAEKTLHDIGGPSLGLWYVTQFVAGEYKFEFEDGVFRTLNITFN